MTLEDQLKEQQAELSKLYLFISAYYKRMSKAQDLYSRQIIQSGIEKTLLQAKDLSDKIEALKAEIMKQWNDKMSGKLLY